MRWIGLLAGLFLWGFPPIAMANCRHALAIGLDVSGSVDLREYRLQIDGLVEALNHPEIVEILLAVPTAPISILVYEWSGPDDQSLLMDWTEITGAETLELISTTLAQSQRRAATPGTALGFAMQTGADYLDQRQSCWKRTLDISGDGKSNLGPRPRDVKKTLEHSRLTINALVIGSDAPAATDRRHVEIGELSSYFAAEVILGSDAFVQTALGFEAYAEAMKQKLKRELADTTVSALQ